MNSMHDRSPASFRRSRMRAPLLVALGLITQACAAPGRQVENVDPFEPLNRQVFAFNETADAWVFRPVAQGYNTVVPKPVRTGVTNFYANLTYPVTIVNGFLQGKVGQGVEDSVRMLVNTVFGVFGIFDPATAGGLPRNQEDFGLTFAHWGIAQGPYVVLPVLGPYTMRSAIGLLGNVEINPAVQWHDSSERAKLLILWFVESRAALVGIDDTMREAFDPYLFMRDAYLQNRAFLLRDTDGADDFPDEFNDDF